MFRFQKIGVTKVRYAINPHEIEKQRQTKYLIPDYRNLAFLAAQETRSRSRPIFENQQRRECVGKMLKGKYMMVNLLVVDGRVEGVQRKEGVDEDGM